MALKAILDTLDGLPEQIAGAYARDEKLGKFRLQVEAVDGYELDNVTGLKSALGAARGERESLELKLREFGDITPGRARDGLAALKKLEKLDPNADVDKMVEAKLAAQLDQIRAKHTEEITKRDTRLGQLRSIVSQQLIEGAARSAIVSAKGDPVLLLPHVQQSMRLVESEDGSFSVKIVDAQGNPRIRDAQGSAMTIDDLVLEMRGHSSFARAFEPTGRTGTGAPPTGTTGGAVGSTRNSMNAAEKAAYISAHGYDAYMSLAEK